MFAIIATGGKQYLVTKGQTITIEKLPQTEGTVVFDEVLLVADKTTHIGTPTVKGATVEGTVEDTVRGKKIYVVKYKAKVRYRRKTGHRQTHSIVKITDIKV